MHSVRLAEVDYRADRRDAVQPTSRKTSVRDLYENLQSAPQDHLQAAQAFLDERIVQAAHLPCDLPASQDQLMEWMKARAAGVTREYSQYLLARRHGEPRIYFRNRAQALYFIRAVAPTKLVDGAWLYGLLPFWREARLQPLVRTYLEELGDGVAAQNHVLLYRQLLISHGCDDLSLLDDRLFEQGALQLALGQLAAQYVPEVIGFNLGYEQLPLHLLITSYELDELGIDPYYFRLHITIDNSATGHARKAVQAVLDNSPVVGDADDFYRRVALGYRLNDIGAGSNAVIAGFDLERELLQMLERKREFAGTVHSDYCRIEGRTVNEWLSGPESIRQFLQALQRRGWIRRNANPQESRFWQLIHGEQAAMFGVFTEYEQQLLHDWIAGEWLASRAVVNQAHALAAKRRRASLRQVIGAATTSDNIVPEDAPLVSSYEIDAEAQALDAELAGLPAAQRERRLLALAAPALHWSPAGLKATRILSNLMH